MSRHGKWIFCLLLFAATLINYLDRQTLSVSASRIAEEMHLTDRDLGRLFFGFLFAYGLAQLFIGPLLDRFRIVPIYALAVAAWSLAGAGTAIGSLAGAGFMLLIGGAVERTRSFDLAFLMAGLMPLLAFAGLVFSLRAPRDPTARASRPMGDQTEVLSA